jgi:hypothetical protein
MNPNDQELRNGLSRGPLSRNGFTDELRRKIEDRLEEAPRRFPARRWIWGGTVSLLAVCLLAIWWWPKSGEPELAPFSASADLTPQEKANLEQKMAAERPLKSAVLIGLRTDEGSADGLTGASRYRTVFVAPQDGRLQQLAEGDGILMPYRQNFWKIANARDLNGTETQVLQTYQVSGKKATSPRLIEAPARLSEKLLFVGNVYASVRQTDLSVRRTEANARRLSASGAFYYWIKDIPQMAASNDRTVWDPKREPHTTLQQVRGGSDSAADGLTADQWFIDRQPGRWVGRTTENGVPFEVSEDVVSKDELTLPWEEISSLEPAAKDAFTSTTGDVVVAVTGSQIELYYYRKHGEASKQVAIPLKQGETIIMMQWATEDKYIDIWKRQVPELLQ